MTRSKQTEYYTLHHLVYVSEPEAINMDLVRTYLKHPAYDLITGNTSYSGDVPEVCDTLLIRSASVVTSKITDIFPNLRYIIRAGTGLDNVDLAFCKEHGISVFNAPGANADAVSDYVIGVMLAALRNFHKLEKQDIQTWNRFKFRGRSLSECTVGLVGYGNIGKSLQRKLSGFNCQGVLVYDPYLDLSHNHNGVTPATFEQLLSTSDIISLHVPLTDQTRYLINTDTLMLLKDNAVLINSSRGGIVHEEDLLAILNEKHITYVADTVEQEPHVNPKLLEHDDVIVTPHIASLTASSERRMVVLALTNYLDHQASPGV